MADRTYKIGNVAKMLDITTPALRKWSIHYGDHLTAIANPGQGKARKYTEDDVSLLQRIANLRSTEDLSHEDILLRLDMEQSAIEDEPEAITDATDATRTTLAPSVDIDTIAPLLAAISAQQVKTEEIHAIQDDVRRIDHATAQVRNILIAVLVAMVLVLVLVIVLILVLR